MNTHTDPTAQGPDFGVLVFPNTSWETLVARAELAEEMGFRSLWVDDHIVNPARPSQTWLESWTTIAGLASRTGRILVGPLVSNVVLRHPVMLARQALSVDAISGGRLQVGLGAGYAVTDHYIVGVRMWDKPERVERFREAVTIIDRLLSSTPVTFAGKHYRVDGLHLRPAPIHRPRPPLCIAAHDDSSLRLVAEFGDSWSSFGGWGLTSGQLIETTRRRAAKLDECCAEIGRDPSSIRRQVLAGSPAVTPDPIWSSVDAFDTWARTWRDIGIDEIICYFPPDVLYSRDLVDPKVLDHLRERLAAAGKTR